MYESLSKTIILKSPSKYILVYRKMCQQAEPPAVVVVLLDFDFINGIFQIKEADTYLISGNNRKSPAFSPVVSLPPVYITYISVAEF